MIRVGLNRSGFLVLLMLLMLVNSGCEPADVMPTEVLTKSTDIENVTTEAANAEASSSETISNPVLVQDAIEEIIIEGNKPVLKHGRLKLDGLQIVD